MPRHDSNSEMMNRDRDSGYRSSGRSRGYDQGRDEGGFFGGEGRDRDREGGFFGQEGRDRDRDEGSLFAREGRDRDSEDRDRNRPMGGWGGLMGDRDRERNSYDQERRYSGRGRDRDRDRERGDRRFGSDDHNRGIPMDETEKLISSNKVEGTPVYDRHGDKLGSIHNFMVHKTKGHVVYAVLKHGGGFLGLNERYYPIEWDQLDYDTRMDGYHIDMTEEDLKNFGSFDSEGRYSRGTVGRDRDSERSRDYDRDRDDRSRRGGW